MFRPQHEALGNNYRVCGVYSPEPRAEVYYVRLNFKIWKLVYLLRAFSSFMVQTQTQQCIKETETAHMRCLMLKGKIITY